MIRTTRILIALGGTLFSTTAYAQVANVRFGNLHAHTSYSDGSGTPDEAYKMACDAGLDFFAITEHNHDKGDANKLDRRDGRTIATHPTLYKGANSSLIESANRLNRAGRCVTLYGQEYSTISSGNHMNIFDVSQIIEAPNGRFDKLVEWLDANPDSRGSKALAQFNHPETGKEAERDYGRDDFGTGGDTNWVQAMAPYVSLIEVLNAPALRRGTDQRTTSRESLYFRYLNLGFHLAPSVGQDNHYKNWGVSTDARVAAITSDFSRNGILDALRSRHAYASEDKNLRVIFKAGNALQGDIITPPALGTELPLTLEIKDDDEPLATYRVDLFKDVPGGKPASAPVETYRFSGNQLTPVSLEGIRFESAGEYVLLRITQYSDADDEHVEEDRLWTAPIWLEEHVFHTLAAAQPMVRMTSLLPDPVGDDYLEERITLQNTGATPVNLSAWRVRDLAENSWPLDGLGTVAAGTKVSIKRNGQPMTLNNGGDTIELVAPDGTVVQTVDYRRVTTGEEVMVDAPES